jgi:hypothetical protein
VSASHVLLWYGTPGASRRFSRPLQRAAREGTGVCLLSTGESTAEEGLERGFSGCDSLSLLQPPGRPCASWAVQSCTLRPPDRFHCLGARCASALHEHFTDRYHMPASLLFVTNIQGFMISATYFHCNIHIHISLRAAQWYKACTQTFGGSVTQVPLLNWPRDMVLHRPYLAGFVPTRIHVEVPTH